jgi:hypothetical protein
LTVALNLSSSPLTTFVVSLAARPCWILRYELKKQKTFFIIIKEYKNTEKISNVSQDLFMLFQLLYPLLDVAPVTVMLMLMLM